MTPPDLRAANRLMRIGQIVASSNTTMFELEPRIPNCGSLLQ